MIRLAIVGVGWAGTRQTQAVRELGRKIEMVSLVDNDPDFLQEKSTELNVPKTYTDYQEALSDPEIDAVSICTPHDFHCPMALDAAAAGKHILVEKPIAMTVADATRMIQAAEKHNVKLYVAENQVYTPMSAFLRDVMATGRYIGEFVTAAYVHGFQSRDFGYPGRRAWLTQPEQGGTGTWMLHGIHSMAQLRSVLGDVTMVYLQEHKASSYQRRDIEGTMSGLFTLERGGHVSILQTSEVKLLHNLGGYTIYGDAGSIRATNDWCEVFPADADKDTVPEIVEYPTAELSGYAQEIEAFADYVLGNVAGPTTGYSERRSLAVVEAGYESARTGQPVNLVERYNDF